MALAPENTIAACEAAVRCGADAIEFDVQRTADGIPVVIHDERVDRTTNGSGLVSELRFEEIGALDAGAWFDQRFAGLRVPSLDEVLIWAGPRAVDLMLELKQPVPASGEPRDKDLALAALGAVRAHGLLERTLFISFDHPTITQLVGLERFARTALLTDGPAPVDLLAPARGRRYARPPRPLALGVARALRRRARGRHARARVGARPPNCSRGRASSRRLRDRLALRGRARRAAEAARRGSVTLG